MSFAVRRAYACPICSESFIKWSICQNHVNTMEMCREALGDQLRDQEALQDLCRLAANGEYPMAAQQAARAVVAAAEAAQAAAAAEAAQAAAAAEAEAEAAAAEAAAAERRRVERAPLVLGALLPAPVPMPVGPVRPISELQGYQWPSAPEKLHYDLLKKNGSERVEDWVPSKLDDLVKFRISNASYAGFLQKDEQSALVKTLNSLTSYEPEEQRLVITKFLSPGYDDFHQIGMKFLWLQRCMDFCRSSSRAERGAELREALELHGLREDALSEECWNTYGMFPAELQESVVLAVRGSLIMKTTKDPSQHFAHLCVNEEAIYNLEAKEVETVQPAQGSWESFSDSQYHEILRQMLVNHRNSEESVLSMLAEETKGIGLLEVHLATKDSRWSGSAELLSLLHASAACGLSRLCARCVAEGLDVNERTGHQHFSPLHLAATNGSLETTEVLLSRGAQAWLLDDSGKTPLYHVVTTLPEATQAPRENLLKICQQLVFGMLQAPEEDQLLVESALEILQQSELSWLLQLHHRMRELQRKSENIFSPPMLVELGRWHYETLNILLSFFDGDRVKLQVPPEALRLEFAAMVQSEFMQDQERIRKKVNVLAKVLHLSKVCSSILAALPLGALTFTCESFTLEERAPGVYEAQDPELLQRDAESEAEEKPRTLNLREDVKRCTGKLVRWESERGFGFIHDEQDTSATPTDIFVHRTNLMGQAPGVPVDLVEGCRVCFMPGLQEGRPRALSCAMVDDEWNVDPRHLVRPQRHKPETFKEKKLARLKDAIEKEEHPLSKSLLQHVASPTIQQVVQEKRQEGDAFLRCLGLVRQVPGRRDDNLWRKEIDRRVDIFLSWQSTPLTKKDIDFRCKRFLTEFCMRNNVVRVSEALAMVEKSTVAKRRDEVRSWPAYVATLLRRFDPEMTANLEQKQKPKAEAKKGATPEKNPEDGETSSGESEQVPPQPGAEFAFQ